MPERKLLQPDHRQAGITGIYQASHTNDRYFTRLYRSTLDSFARLVQQLPASEVDHHAVPGGLLDPALESALNALRIRRAHMLPADAAPEDVSRHEPLWTYAVFAAALVHDVGKVAVDQRITLCVANCCSSCYGELMNPSAVSLPAEFIQLDWKFGHDASDFCRRITTK